MKILIAFRSTMIPLWMYYVRCLVDILCAIVNLFLLPFGRVCNLNAIWQGKMLRSAKRPDNCPNGKVKINTNREVEIFDNAYKLGFRAGQLDWRAYMIAENYYIRASTAGARIAVERGNISMEEYKRIAKSHEED